MAAMTGLPRRMPGRSHRAGPVLADRAAVTAGERLEVGAGAEDPARPGEHGHGRRVVGVERLERVEQQPGGHGIDGVAPLRAGRS